MKSPGLGILSALLALFSALWTVPVAAEGDMTRRATRLEPLVLDARSGFSPTRFELETGVYYRLRIESDGLEDYEIAAPEFFSQIWIDRVEIEDMSIQPTGLVSVELGDEGAVDIWFIPIRAGTYEIEAEGLESQGFSGEIVVK